MTITKELIKEIVDEAIRLMDDYPELTAVEALREAKEMIIDEVENMEETYQRHSLKRVYLDKLNKGVRE